MNGIVLDRSGFSEDSRLSESVYNLTIGSLLLYGFAVNALICRIFGDSLYYSSGATSGIILIGYILCVILSVVLSQSPSPIVNFLGYNLLVLPIGIMLSIYVAPLTAQSVQTALIGTALFVVLMVAAAYARPDFFLSMGSTLLVSLTITLIAEIVLMLLHFGTGLFDYLFVGIFSMYLGFDWARANQCAPTARNAVLSATQIYLDIINIFIRLLAIFGKRRRS